MTDISNLPAELREKGLFCLWRCLQRGDRCTKVPYDPRTGRMAQSNEPATFAPLETALAAAQGGYEGLGVGIFGEICAIDIDHCVKEDGTFTQVGTHVMGIMDSYTEYSPSGEGLHILFKAPGFRYDKATYYINNAKLGLEVYVAGATSKYVTVTGNMLAGSDRTLRDCGARLQQVLDRYMRREPAAEQAQAQMDGLLARLADSFGAAGGTERRLEALERVSSPTAMRPGDMRGGTEGLAQQGTPCHPAPGSAATAGGTSAACAQGMGSSTPLADASSELQLLRKAIASRGGAQFDALYRGSKQGYPSHSEADLALCSKLAFWTGCDRARMDRMFRASGLMRRDKWDRPQSGSTYGALTIDKAVRDNRETYTYIKGGTH